MKIVVTGGLGFIGSHLVDEYILLGHEVIILDNVHTGNLFNVNPKARLVSMCLTDERLDEWMIEEKPDLVNHHAALVNIRTSSKEPLLNLGINLLGTIRLLQAIVQAKVKKVIFASTSAVYGHSKSYKPISENNTPVPASPYAIHKLAAEHYFQFYKQQFNYDWVIMRYSNVYGMRQNIRSESGVISMYMDRFTQDLEPLVYSDGTQVRDYVHIEDVIAANRIMLQSKVPWNEIYNVGSGKGTSIQQLLALFHSLFPNGRTPIYKPAISGELAWNVLSISKLESLGWKPMRTLNDALHDLKRGRGSH